MAEPTQYKYAAYFKLYGTQNLQVSFALMEDDPILYLKQLEGMLSGLFNDGYRVEPEGLEQGEVIREADSWVLGKTSKDDLCVHLYKFPLKWKVATVYAEALAKLPFMVPAGTVPILGGPPEREIAEKNKFLHKVLDFKVVLIPTGAVDEKGRPKLKFDRVFGATASPEARSNGVDETESVPFDDNISYTDSFNYLDNPSAKKFITAARAQQAKSKKSVEFEQLSEMISKLDHLYGETGHAEVALCVLAGIDDVPELDNKLSAEVVKSLNTSLERKPTQDMMVYLMNFVKQIYGS